MLKRVFLMILLTCVVSTAAYGYQIEQEQRSIAGQMIRLHVVANSDTQADQALKLKVRDAIAVQVEDLTADCKDVQDARRILAENLDAFAESARCVLQNHACADAVTVSLGTELFPRRDYDTFSLPAGKYQALRITIGKGAGHNWWCVAFPALCLPATTQDFTQAAQACGLSGQQTELMSGEGARVEIKFWLLEWLGNLWR